MGYPLPGMHSAPQAERAAEAKDSGTGGVTFAELEVVSVSGIQKEGKGLVCGVDEVEKPWEGFLSLSQEQKVRDVIYRVLCRE